MLVGLYYFEIIMNFFFFLIRRDLICVFDVYFDLIIFWCWYRDLFVDVGVINRGGFGFRVSDIYRRGIDYRGLIGR